MDAVKFIEERNRMCGTMSEVWGVDAAQIVKNTEEWAAAHPRKTRQSVFLEQWPDTQLDKKGNVIICPKQLCRGEEFNKLIAACRGTNCYECRRKFWGKVVEWWDGYMP